MDSLSNILKDKGSAAKAQDLKKESDSTLMICKECGEQQQKEIVILGTSRVVPVLCKCKKEKREQQTKEEKAREKQDKLRQLFTNSLMDKKFEKETFENWDFSKGKQQMYNMGVKYCEKFQEAKSVGLGFLFHGTPGNGKTYLSNCIANRLLNNMHPVICVSINALLERIRKTYSKWGQEGEDTILNALSLADLLIIDDLGTEQDTEWSKSRIYNIIDNRYRNKLPLIVSTNKSIEELKKMYHERTIDRLVEMCTPIENTSKSIRTEQAKRNTNLLREILK
jgi:DNA replication protein DnaC